MAKPRQASHRRCCGRDGQVFSGHTGDVSVQASEEHDSTGSIWGKWSPNLKNSHCVAVVEFTTLLPTESKACVRPASQIRLLKSSCCCTQEYLVKLVEISPILQMLIYTWRMRDPCIQQQGMELWRIRCESLQRLRLSLIFLKFGSIFRWKVLSY